MPVSLICASHTPMLFNESYASSEICSRVRNSFDRMAEFVEDFKPDKVIQFSPDHFHGFLYNNMPSFCLGTSARSYGDWGTSTGNLRVDEEFALALLKAVREADIDLSVSFDMIVDHGFTQIWEALWGNFTRYPIIPIFVNSIARPLPSYKRARILGEAVGRFAAVNGQRILFVASGGLSHDPVIPRILGASPALHDRLTGRAIFGPEQQAAREAEVMAAAEKAMKGAGPARPLNPEWDLHFLDLLERGDWATIDAFTDVSIDEVAGCGGNEVLCWVAATAALAASGPFRVVQKDYVDVPGWIAGMGHFSAISLPIS